MKLYTLTFVFITLCFSLSFAQSDSSITVSSKKKSFDQKTVFGGTNKALGVYIALEADYTEINAQSCLFTGARLMAVVNHWFAIGVGGKGMTHSINTSIDQTNYNNYIGYGGLYLEPTIASKSIVHLSFPTLIGVGGTYEEERNTTNDFTLNSTDNKYESYSKAFVIIEPGANIEMNLSKNIRLGLGASYKFSEGLQQESKMINKSLKKSQFEGFNSNITLKFGIF